LVPNSSCFQPLLLTSAAIRCNGVSRVPRLSGWLEPLLVWEVRRWPSRVSKRAPCRFEDDLGILPVAVQVHVCTSSLGLRTDYRDYNKHQFGRKGKGRSGPRLPLPPAGIQYGCPGPVMGVNIHAILHVAERQVRSIRIGQGKLLLLYLRVS
jgi:hypothetical protein